MDVTQYLHPLMQRGMTKDPNSVYNALINALNSPLNNAESDILRSKTNIMLAQAPEDWLDTFGSWLGLKRKDKEPDNVYRKRLMEWVLTDKNDVSSIRNAIANFLNISSDCVYVYEPYTDMLYYNKLGSDYNSLKYFASSYYNYCVIDVQIDNTFPIREIQDIINLFRPAGVIYVLTMNINSFNHNAPIIDMGEDGSTPMFYDETYYAGFNQRVQGLITPSLSDDVVVTNPFFYSENLSLFNEGKEYQNQDSQFNDYMTLGEYYKDYNPNDSDTFTSGRVYSKNYSLQDNMLLSKSDNKYLKFNINKFDSDYSNKINNINFSARNLLRSSQSRNDNSLYNVNGIKHNDTFLGANIYEQQGTWQGQEFRVQDLVSRNVINTTDTYTFSTYVKYTGDNPSSMMYFYNGDGTILPVKGQTISSSFEDTTPNTWNQISWTFKFNSLTPPSSGKFYIGFEFNQSGYNGNVYWACPKLEKGTKATDYSIAPEDIDSSLNDNNQPLFVNDIHTTNTIGSINIHFESSNNHKYSLSFDSIVGNPVFYGYGLTIDKLNDTSYIISDISENSYIGIFSKETTKINNVSIIELNTGEKTTTTYNYNTYPNKSLGISGVADVIGALQTYFSLPTNINKNNLLTDYYSESYLTIKMKSDVPIKSTHNIDIYIYDFSANIWSLFRTISIDDTSYINQNIKINDYSNILNYEGCLFYKIVSDIDIDVDYFGLSFSNYVYNEPKLNSYFNSIELIDTTVFNDGKLGCWDRNYTKDINLWKFNDSNITSNYINYSTGELVSSNADICSAEIECKPNTTYTLALPLCSTNLGNNVVVFYDKNHKLISSPLHGGGSSANSFDSLPKATFTSPENAAFMRVSLNTGNNNKDAVVSLIEGNEYIPYPQYLSISPDTNTLTGNDGLGRFIMSNTLKHVCYGDTYQVDCWISTTSGATIGVVDPDNKYFYASNTLSTSDSGWQEITGDITINVYNNTNAVYPLIEIKDDDCNFEISDFTITKKQ